ncbi:BsuBI/PstI family type II restriction endonuclease [Bifidobacterium pseudolongum]|uniref:Restriction endonuclease BsuBI n=1 Tax=Bifidobacterium pseudolongum subsp. globosum TaxID=1690 RepID=A0A2N3R5X9_9BIFI|nr:BsuBI/PstI family type II restriction endonuclease [Bifidobacterium pseudolongum]PKV04764.1 restriction endonuclease BsuBI [Bifidobacterium pseudolongum subsp. globosum]
MDKNGLIADAMDVLQEFEVGEEQQNERSAMTLLALLHLKPGDEWCDATAPMLTTRGIMDWIRDYFGVAYKPNTRETIRRFTLHQFIIAKLVEENADKPDRPINSPNWNYRVTADAFEVLQQRNKPVFEKLVKHFLLEHESYRSLAEERRDMPKTPVTLPSGGMLSLSPSGQSVLIKAIVEEMLPRFAPDCRIAYIDDTDHQHGIIDSNLMDELGISLKAREKAPDVIAWDGKRKWLFLIEAASTHGPVDVTRKQELRRLFADRWEDVVLVSGFPNRKTMQRYLAVLAWETEAWCADTPEHMIHLNGSRFMGPYGE